MSVLTVGGAILMTMTTATWEVMMDYKNRDPRRVKLKRRWWHRRKSSEQPLWRVEITVRSRKLEYNRVEDEFSDVYEAFVDGLEFIDPNVEVKVK